MQTWQYLTLWFEYAAKQVEPALFSGTQRVADAKWEYKASWLVRYPDGQEETREQEPATTPALLSILNELGHDGWELVDRTVFNSTIAPKNGWHEASHPIGVTYIFKRPIT